MVKLKFIPVKNPYDLVLIPNIDALKFAFQALLAQDKGDPQKYAMYLGMAIQDLNRELEDRSPDDQFSAIDSTFGGAVFTNNVF